MDIGEIKKIGPCLHHSVLYFGETSMCLCRIVSVNIHYVKKCYKNSRQNQRENKRECFSLLE